jgi:hypothetical protein
MSSVYKVKYKSPNNVEYSTVIVEKFTLPIMNNVYDIDLLNIWITSVKGEWIMKRSLSKPIIQSMTDHSDFSTKYIITAELSKNDETMFYLKF